MLVLAALLMVGMLTMAGIVVDLGMQRFTRHDNQSAADLAALAAGPELTEGHPRQACTAAWSSLRANLSALPAAASSPCTAVPATASCTGATTHTSSGAGPYVITVRYPVSATDIADPRRTGGIGPLDGDACGRMRITVTRTNNTFFGGVVGISRLAASGSAVVRASSATAGRIPALWLLDPVGCVALDVQGGAHVTVGSAAPTVVPGYIVVDSDGTACTGSQRTIDVGGSGSQLVAVPTTGSTLGAIGLHALPVGATACTTRACDAADVAGGTLVPQPMGLSRRATRAPVDHRFDCKSAYPMYRGIVPIAPCPDAGTTPAHITNLISAVGASGAPSGFTTFNDCNPAGVQDVIGNVFVNCASFKLTSGAVVNFKGGNVIFKGDVTLNNSTMTVNGSNPVSSLPSSCRATIVGCATTSSSGAAFVYLRGGTLKAQQSTLSLLHTVVVEAAGGVDMGGSGSAFTWSAPVEGPFAGLALWSESTSAPFTFSAGGSMATTGTFFTPGATFALAGGTTPTVQHAQFVSYRLTIAGGAALGISPDPVVAVSDPQPAVALIR